MTITNTITGTSITTNQTNRKWAKTYIDQEILWMNELESDKPKNERYYYSESNFKIKN
jgi:fructosamine-3-kinase